MLPETHKITDQKDCFVAEFWVLLYGTIVQSVTGHQSYTYAYCTNGGSESDKS